MYEFLSHEHNILFRKGNVEKKEKKTKKSHQLSTNNHPQKYKILVLDKAVSGKVTEIIITIIIITIIGYLGSEIINYQFDYFYSN